jgi:hypothetical protein
MNANAEGRGYCREKPEGEPCELRRDMACPVCKLPLCFVCAVGHECPALMAQTFTATCELCGEAFEDTGAAPSWVAAKNRYLELCADCRPPG